VITVIQAWPTWHWYMYQGWKLPNTGAL